MGRPLTPVAAVLTLIAGIAIPTAFGQEIPAGVKSHKDIVYAQTVNGPLKLDVYIPDNAAHPMPVIVRISPHREEPARPANELLAKGYALVYAGYLPDDAPHTRSFNLFPTDLRAAKAAVRWTRGNAAGQGFDADRIGVWGSDHGATLAALLAVTPDQPNLNGTFGNYPALSSEVRAACLFGGTTDWRNAELYGDETVNLPGSPAYQLFGANPKENPDDARIASAVNYIRPLSPAVLMVTLASDSNRAMHLIFAETLRRAGVPSALYEEPPGSGAGPGGHAVDEAKLDRTILDFFNDTLAPNQPRAEKITVDREIQQLAAAGLYKQARRIIEEQLAAAPNSTDRQQWLTKLRQISDQQREPALQKLAAAMKLGKATPNTQWTIREVLTNPERIGEYQVEATLSPKTFDAHADTLKQIETLNGYVLQKDWAGADRFLAAFRASVLASHDKFSIATFNEFVERYAAIKSNPDQSSPPDVRPVGFATAFGQDLYGFWFDLRAGGAIQRFRYISPDSFLRGSSPDEWGRLPGEPPLVATEIKEGFWLSDSPISQQMWEGVMGASENHSHFRGATLPADSVSYAHAVNFVAKLGVDARLPTEAEWEYACRAGTRAPYAGTGRLSDIAWFWDEARGDNDKMNVRILNELETDRTVETRSTHELKQKLPNRWGLYDMQGNVWEWCSGASAEKPRDYHVLRGGSWISIPQSCRAAREAWFPIEEEAWNVGLRVVIPAQQLQ